MNFQTAQIVGPLIGRADDSRGRETARTRNRGPTLHILKHELRRICVRRPDLLRATSKRNGLVIPIEKGRDGSHQEAHCLSTVSPYKPSYNENSSTNEERA